MYTRYPQTHWAGFSLTNIKTRCPAGRAGSDEGSGRTAVQ